jgi:hypothetical protein
MRRYRPRCYYSRRRHAESGEVGGGRVEDGERRATPEAVSSSCGATSNPPFTPCSSATALRAAA